jgi:hypothetical protein
VKTRRGMADDERVGASVTRQASGLRATA